MATTADMDEASFCAGKLASDLYQMTVIGRKEADHQTSSTTSHQLQMPLMRGGKRAAIFQCLELMKYYGTHLIPVHLTT